MIISLYAGGMTVRDIGHHLNRTLGVELSADTISKITDAVLDECKAWQHRPLDPVYPILYIDALVVKVRDSPALPGRGTRAEPVRPALAPRRPLRAHPALVGEVPAHRGQSRRDQRLERSLSCRLGRQLGPFFRRPRRCEFGRIRE